MEPHRDNAEGSQPTERADPAATDTAGPTDSNVDRPLPGGGFGQFLSGVPPFYALLSAAIAAASTLLPDSVIPEPLDELKVLGPALITVAFVIGWVWRKAIGGLLGIVTILTGVAVVGFLSANSFLVCDVTYYREVDGEPVEERRSFLRGWHYVDPLFEEAGCDAAIQTQGGEAEDLKAIWGTSFVQARLIYAFTYLGSLFGIVISLARIQMEGEQELVTNRMKRTRASGTSPD